MAMLYQFMGDGGHALAAAMFAALTIYILRSHAATLERNLLCAAIFMTAFWALHTAFGGVTEPLSGISESVRNAAWLLFMFVMLRRGEGRLSDHPASITVIYAILGCVLLLQMTAEFAPREYLASSFEALVMASLMLHMVFAVGALVLVHNLYTISAPEGRARIALIMAGLAAMWTYDLNLYTLTAITQGSFAELYAMRGLFMTMVAMVMGLGLRGGGEWRLRVSRTVAFRSFSLVAVGVYLSLLGFVVAAIEWIFGPQAHLIETGILFAALVTSLVLLPAHRVRARVHVLISKHFFQHRYDYRVEWTRFIDTIGASGAPLHERVVKAVADITESSSGLLLLRDDNGGLSVECLWNWPEMACAYEALSPHDAAALEHSGWIVDIDAARIGGSPLKVAPWMLADHGAWALVPLIHFNRLAGAILLGRPLVDRRLDWEDFDMLRAAGRQVASYISEAQGQQALEDARRFDEFNRRFAFIMHDVKNLVSQLSLLSRNAERHAENPAFRADMLLTLKDSVGKMNDLLARLSQHNKGRQEEPTAIDIAPIARAVAATRARQHPVEIMGTSPDALADPQRVEQILLHLIQNAIDASPANVPVIVHLGERDGGVTVRIADKGCGMTADFVRRDLFKPFASSKAGGFGIGAFEARELAHSMGGRIDVESRLGEGSSFTLTLPRAPQRHALQERAA
ncbi:PEP-CTERM system histidine kinase PrsK [Sphingobium sp. SCG-1]|uniref:XrtA/PEP-CTERM system histidine kinase PrsK n=1 Tax=Sphingobium sp. SCG-1 TaxID=2072936 RepID=UPI000CD69100|nr:XrtA/PEP-CTERM system histidine kinase PrsK [Sphingobium sp. SCG-1]AUW58271.1 PEP-CTERM system histidine kinase PrsK [Sphingobium sp. SCG-1]